MKNRSLDEVDSPQARSKLEGYQEVVFDIAKELERLDDAIERKKGVVEACGVLVKRIEQECQATMDLVDKNEMKPNEAKIRNDQTMKIIGVLRDIGERNTRDLVVMQGRREGMVSSCDVVERRFEMEKMKFERWKRMEEEDAEEEVGEEEKGQEASV